MKIALSTKEAIARAAVEKGFEKLHESIKKQESKLAIQAYNSIFDKKIRDIIATVPEKWLQEDSCLRFNANGWDVRLCAEKPQRVPHSHGCGRLGNITGELAEAIQKHHQEKEKLKTDYSRAYHKILGFLQQFGSYKKLREAWPEGKEFYSKYDVEPDKNGVPSVVVSEINQILGLKTKKAA